MILKGISVQLQNKATLEEEAKNTEPCKLTALVGNGLKKVPLFMQQCNEIYSFEVTNGATEYTKYEVQCNFFPIKKHAL